MSEPKKLPKALSGNERCYVITAVKNYLNHCEDRLFALPGGDFIDQIDVPGIVEGLVAAFAAQAEVHRLLTNPLVTQEGKREEYAYDK